VSFIFEDNVCTIQIKDNGKGFDTSTQKHGLGLWNMQERAMAIGADISIHAAYQVGTTVTLRLVRMEETQ
jgi:signal transduction histidine kinase